MGDLKGPTQTTGSNNPQGNISALGLDLDGTDQDHKNSGGFLLGEGSLLTYQQSREPIVSE